MIQGPFFLEKAPFNHLYPIKRMLYQGKTVYQEVLIFETEEWGRVLALDHIVQFTEKDEFIYHESLIQPPMHSHPQPRKVLVVGGGDGHSLREVLKHPEVEQVVLVELDGELVEIMEQHFPETRQYFRHPKVTLRFEDGYQYLERGSDTFDLIFIDLTDPIGQASRLFQRPFLDYCVKALKEGGMVALQTGSIFYHRNWVQSVYSDLSQLVPQVAQLTVTIPTYPGYLWVFTVGSKGQDPRLVSKKAGASCRFYSPEIHSSLFLGEKERERFLHLGLFDF